MMESLKEWEAYVRRETSCKPMPWPNFDIDLDVMMDTEN